MKKLIASIFAVASSVAVANSAVLVGLDPLTDNGGADGWSGVTVLDTPIAGAGQITDWAFHTDDDARAATIATGEHYVTPLLVGRDNVSGAVSILGVGAEVQINVAGVHQQAFGLATGSADFGGDAGTTYLGGVFQRRAGVDDDAGGIIPFAGAGGGGMFQINVDGTTYAPTAGEELAVAGHASGADGRNYAFNLQGDAVPEPSVPLFLTAALGLFGFLRRRR